MKDTQPYIVPATDHYYTEIVSGEFLKKENALRIIWVSDNPSDQDIVQYLNQRFPSLKNKTIDKIYHDDPWHFNKSGSAYGLIVVFFKG